MKKGSGMKSNAKSNDTTKKTKFIQYDGGLKSDFTSETTIDPNSDRYLAVTLDGKGRVKANVTFVGDPTRTSAMHAVFVDGSGNKLGEVVENDNRTAEASADVEIMATVNTEENTDVYLMFSRNGEIKKGTLRVTTIEVSPLD